MGDLNYFDSFVHCGYIINPNASGYPRHENTFINYINKMNLKAKAECLVRTSDSLGVLDVNLGSNWETSVASDLLLKEGMCGGGYRFSSTMLQSTEEKKRCAFTVSAPEVPSRFSTGRRSSFLIKGDVAF